MTTATTKDLILIKDYAIAEGYELDAHWLRRLGQLAFDLYKSRYGTKPPTISRKGQKGKGYDLIEHRDILEGALMDLVQLMNDKAA